MKTAHIFILVACLLVSSLLITACSSDEAKDAEPLGVASTPLATIPITALSAGQVTQVKTLQGHNEQAFSVTFSPDGALLASGGGYPDHTVRLWDTHTGGSVRVIDAHKHLVWRIAFSPDGNTMATASEDGTLRLWEVSTGKQLAELDRLDRAVYGAAFTPDGKTLASVDGYKAVKLWDVATREQIGLLEDNQQLVQSLAISPDGALLVTGGGDATVRLWNLPTRESLGILGEHGGVINDVAFSPDGTWVASAALGGEVTLWNVKTGASQDVMYGDIFSPGVFSVAFSPDGSVLAYGIMDGTIGLWDVTAGQGLAELRGHTDEVTGLAFSPDGTLLASASLDGIISLWGVREGGTAETTATPNRVLAPEFSVIGFDGNQLTLAEMRGKVVVINFWTSFAPPCQQEAHVLERLWNEYRDNNVVFLGINQVDAEKDATAYLDRFNITYANAPDSDQHITDQYGITGVPETVVINTTGEIIRHFIGPVDESELRAEIERALNSASAAGETSAPAQNLSFDSSPIPVMPGEAGSSSNDKLAIRSVPGGLNAYVVPKDVAESPFGDVNVVKMTAEEYFVGRTPVEVELEPGEYRVTVELDESFPFRQDGEEYNLFVLTDAGGAAPIAKIYALDKHPDKKAHITALFWREDMLLEEFVASLPDEELFSITDPQAFETRFQEYAIPPEDWPNLLLMWRRTGKLVWYSSYSSESLIISATEPGYVNVEPDQAAVPAPTPTSAPSVVSQTPAPNVQVFVVTMTPLPGGCALNSEMIISGTGAAGLNVRSEPGLTAAVAFHANEGERVQVIDVPQFSNDLEWCQVRREQDGATGWAVRDYLIEAAVVDAGVATATAFPGTVPSSGDDTLLVRSVPPGLEVYAVPADKAVGGFGESYTTHPDYFVGNTPLEIELEPGEYWVTVSKMDDPIDFRADGEDDTVFRVYLDAQGQMSGAVTAGKSYLITKRAGHQAIVTALFWPKDQALADFVATLPAETLFPVIDSQFLAETFAVHGVPSEDQPILQDMLSRIGKLVWYSPDGTQHLYVYFSEPDQAIVEPFIPIPSDSTSGVRPLLIAPTVIEANTAADQINLALSAPVEFYVLDGN